MDYELRITVEKVAIGTQVVVKRDTIKVYDIKPPQTVLDLGLRHEEQISLLAKVQNALLSEQTVLIEADPDTCPNCGKKARKNGFHQSNFHAVFSDHKLCLRKHHCINPECHWSSSPTIKSVFGTNIHPDLAKFQCEQGAIYSYREAQRNLEKLNCKPRRVNNHTQVKRFTDKVGSVLSAQNSLPIASECCTTLAEALIVQIDGGHIPIQDKTQRSFEALSGTVYRPDSICPIDQHHREIKDKTCAISALSDRLQTMKIYLLNAAWKQGLTGQTEVTALADGAKNCWSAVSVLEPHCKKLVGILDWFHIGKKFQTVKNSLEAEFDEALESSKWMLWHGKVEKALAKLAEVQTSLEDKKQQSKLTGLYEFIARNKAYIVNYEQRRQSELIFTSQTAESHVESLINARHKRSGKMQWNRESAHNVLQIRAKIASNEWDYQWQETVLAALRVAA